MKTNDYRAVLRREFDAEDGSFWEQLRCAGTWDVSAFDRLVDAMEACCRDNEGGENLERWMALGFWYFDTTVGDQTLKSGMRLVCEPAYYERAFRRLSELAYWYFHGEAP